MTIDWPAHAGALLNTSIRKAETLGGGDLSPVVQLTLEDGRGVVAKGGAFPRREATMLRALAATGAPAPDVLAADATMLILTRVDGDSGPGGAWADLGRQLARLHAAGGETYGWREDYAFGTVPIVNTRTTDWPGFWGENRLRLFAPHIESSLMQRVDALCRDLGNRLPARPRAALLHGDLWGGNVMTRNDRLSAFIDPACYYGDPEVDLAMLHLFDRPPPAFSAAYGELCPGFRERRPIYTLWPALVHLRLFGGAYAGLVDRLLSEAGV